MILGLKQPEEQLIVSDAWDRDLSCPARSHVEGDIWKRTNGEGGDVRVKGRGKYRRRRSYWHCKRKDLNKTCER